MKISKTEIALDRIEIMYHKYGTQIFMGHSGGKDSTVLLHLVQQIIPNIMLVHNVKPMLGESNDPVSKLTEMHPYTLDFIYRNVARSNLIHFMPASNMKKFIKNYGLVCQIDGSRACEYTRKGKSSEIVRDGAQVSRDTMTEVVETGLFDLTMSYPIYDWSDDDIFDYIFKHGLQISSEYIDNCEIFNYFMRKDASKLSFVGEEKCLNLS